jgi:benzoate/toluate 1,2-dioxygenase alpha subunit
MRRESNQVTASDTLIAAWPRNDARTVKDLIDDRPEQGVFRVHKSIYSDPAIFDLELKRIFAKAWIYICHESQLKRPGDYVATDIAHQPIFAMRTTKGGVSVYFDACAHRGARLTTGRTGHAPTITCRYHGWCFNTEGKCTKIQFEKLGWPDGLPKDFDANLRAVPRVASYRGFVFASLDAAAESLESFLGEATCKVIDLLADQSPDGLEVLDGSIRYRMGANWKFQCENGADGYHVAAVHRNYAATVVYREQLEGPSIDPLKSTEAGRILNRVGTATGSYDLGRGHMLNWSDRANPAATPLYEREAQLLERFPAEHVRWMVRRGRVFTGFPNFLLNDVASTSIRVWRPISANETELETWCFAPIGESEKARTARIRKFEDFFFPSSLAVPDDVFAMEAAHQGNSATDLGWIRFARGYATAVDGADEPARSLGMKPASSNSQGDSETVFSGFYRRWLGMMTNGD